MKLRISFLRTLLLGLVLAMPALVPLHAQNKVCPTAAPGDSTNKCASTAFVQGAVSGANGISALTGDVSATGPGSVPATLATVNSTPGSYGSSTQCVVLTTNAKGLVTASAQTACAPNPLTSSAITGASTTFTSAQNHTLVSRSNSGAAMGDTLPGTSPGVLPAGTIVNVANTDTAGIESIAVGAGAAFKTAVASTGYVYLCPGQSAAFYSDGSNYWQIDPPGRCVFKANTTIFIATTGLATNDGLTVSTPVLDPTFAYNLAKNSFDLAGNTITFSLASGTYSKINIQGPLLGVAGGRIQSNVKFLGNPTTPANVIISDPSAFNAGGSSAVFLNTGVIADFNGFQIISANNYDFVVNNASISNIQNIDFHQVGSGSNHILSTGGSDLVVVGNYTISSGGGCHWLSGNFGVIETFIPGGVGTITITLTGTPAFATAFACIQFPGLISTVTPLAFSGAATGVRYFGTGNGVFAVGGSATFFPGNAAGTLSTGAQYQ